MLIIIIIRHGRILSSQPRTRQEMEASSIAPSHAPANSVMVFAAKMHHCGCGNRGRDNKTTVFSCCYPQEFFETEPDTEDQVTSLVVAQLAKGESSQLACESFAASTRPEDSVNDLELLGLYRDFKAQWDGKGGESADRVYERVRGNHYIPKSGIKGSIFDARSKQTRDRQERMRVERLKESSRKKREREEQSVKKKEKM